MPAFIRKKQKNIVYWRVAFLERQAPVKAIYSSRAGGLSLLPYTGLNLALHVGDDSARVIANRRLLAETLNLPLENWVIGQQVHGDKIALVERRHAGCGSVNSDTVLKGVDAMVTAEPGVTLAAFYADCVPIYIVDPVKRSLGLVHAGWKGTVLGIGGRVVARMAKEFNSCPADLLAAIGPAIGPCCYQVDSRVEMAVKEERSWANKVLTPDGSNHYRLDLPRANYLELIAAGLRPENIEFANFCTCCLPDIFFSYRAAAGHTGRQAALLSLR